MDASGVVESERTNETSQSMLYSSSRIIYPILNNPINFITSYHSNPFPFSPSTCAPSRGQSFARNFLFEFCSPPSTHFPISLLNHHKGIHLFYLPANRRSYFSLNTKNCHQQSSNMSNASDPSTVSGTSKSASNPFVFDKPFAFLWLTAEEKSHEHKKITNEVFRLSTLTNELTDHDPLVTSNQTSFSFIPHITLHSTKLEGLEQLDSLITKTKQLAGCLLPKLSSNNAKNSSNEDYNESFERASQFEASSLNVALSAPLKGVTHFKSVYLDVIKGDHSKGYDTLLRMKEEAKKLFGENQPFETQYLPHMSLWYGSNSKSREIAYNSSKGIKVDTMGLDGSKIHSDILNPNSAQLLSNGISSYDITHIHLVYAPYQDTRSWQIVGSSRIGYELFFWRNSFVSGYFTSLSIPFNPNISFESTLWAKSFINSKYNRQIHDQLDNILSPSVGDSASSKESHYEPALLKIVNPSNGEVMAYFEEASKSQVGEAISSAVSSFPEWSSPSNTSKRSSLLKKISDLILQNENELSMLETADNGKPLKEALADIRDAARTFSYYSSLCQKLLSKDGQFVEYVDVESEDFDCRVEYVPIGPCGMIIPFNYPLLMAAWKIAPAMAAGCTMVVKPSEMTSASALYLAHLLIQAQIPDGVVNILIGNGPTVGNEIVLDQRLKKLAFTGSNLTGTKLLSLASSRSLPRFTLELGGKSPLLYFDDAPSDEQMLDWILMGIFFNSGQVCSATSRLIVHSSRKKQLLEKLIHAASHLNKQHQTVGDGLKSETLMGPLVSHTQLKRVRTMVSKGIMQGAKLLIGEDNNYATSEEELSKEMEKISSSTPCFVLPTILENVDESNILWKEEVFGPVLVVREFEREEDAVKMANETPFGLAAAVFTQDEQRADRVTSKIEAGIVWNNCSQPTFVQAPWGGMKQSGIGRELGPYGLYNFLEAKQVTSWSNQRSSKPFGSWNWYSKITSTSKKE